MNEMNIRNMLKRLSRLGQGDTARAKELRAKLAKMAGGAPRVNESPSEAEPKVAESTDVETAAAAVPDFDGMKATLMKEWAKDHDIDLEGAKSTDDIRATLKKKTNTEPRGD